MAVKVRRYAQDTKVPAGITKDEIERLLRKGGASQIFSGFDEDTKQITLGWRLEGRNYKLTSSTDRPTRRCDEQQIEREAWRVLLLLLKAKLEVIAAGGTTFESEFLANLLLPDGSTVGEDVLPKVAIAYENATMPNLLGAGA
jgi:hypothetical protein